MHAEKGGLIFGRKLHLHLKVVQLENDVANVGIVILCKGIPQQKMEEEFVDTLYKYF